MKTADTFTVNCFVKCSGSDNVTNTINGKRASSTSGPLQAAERLAGKLYGDDVLSVTEVQEGNQFVRCFRMTVRAGDAVQETVK